MQASHEVWARMVWAAVDLAELGGLPTSGLLEGLPFDAAGLRRQKRVSWDHYCTIVERIGELAGPGGLEDLLEANYHQVFPELRTIAGALIGPKALYRLVYEINALAFPPVAPQVDELGGDRLRITTILRPGARPCETFFRGSVGAIRGLPRVLNLPSAEILSVELGGDGGTYEIRVPESRTLADRARRAVGLAVRTVLGIESDGTPLVVTFGEAPEDSDAARLAGATARWKLTPRQTEVLRFVVRGDANKDIACALGCAENTIELHVTQLLRRAGARSRTQLVARFWSESRSA